MLSKNSKFVRLNCNVESGLHFEKPEDFIRQVNCSISATSDISKNPPTILERTLPIGGIEAQIVLVFETMIQNVLLENVFDLGLNEFKDALLKDGLFEEDDEHLIVHCEVDRFLILRSVGFIEKYKDNTLAVDCLNGFIKQLADFDLVLANKKEINLTKEQWYELGFDSLGGDDIMLRDNIGFCDNRDDDIVAILS